MKTEEFKNLNFLTFCGADFVVKFNDKVYGFLENFYFDEKSKTIEVKCSILSPVVDEVKEFEPEMDFRKNFKSMMNGKVEQFFCNEYGLKGYRKFRGVKYLGAEGDINIDTYDKNSKYIYGEKYKFSFDSVSPLYLIPSNVSLDDAPKFIEEHLKKKAEAEAAKKREQDLDYINRKIHYLNKEKEELEKNDNKNN